MGGYQSPPRWAFCSHSSLLSCKIRKRLVPSPLTGRGRGSHESAQRGDTLGVSASGTETLERTVLHVKAEVGGWGPWGSRWRHAPGLTAGSVLVSTRICTDKQPPLRRAEWGRPPVSQSVGDQTRSQLDRLSLLTLRPGVLGEVTRGALVRCDSRRTSMHSDRAQDCSPGVLFPLFLHPPRLTGVGRSL